MGAWLAGKIIGRVVSWFVSVVAGALDTLWGLLSSTVLRSPDVTRLPQVQAFATTSLAVVNGAYVLAFLWAGIVVMGAAAGASCTSRGTPRLPGTAVHQPHREGTALLACHPWRRS